MFTNNKTKDYNEQFNHKSLITTFTSTKTTIVEGIVTLEKKEEKTEKINTNYKITSGSNKLQDLINKFEPTCNKNVSANKLYCSPKSSTISTIPNWQENAYKNNTLKTSTTPSGTYLANNNPTNSLNRTISTLSPTNLRTSTIYSRPSFKTNSYQPNSRNLNLENSDSLYNNTWKKPLIMQDTNKNRTSTQFPHQSNINTNLSVKSKAGVLYIIHHDEFKKSWIPFKKQISFREGSKRDVESLEKAFTKFNLTIEKHENLKKDDIKKLMNQIEKVNFSDNSCIVFALLSHGDRNNMLYSFDGKKYSVFDSIIFNLVKNKTLKGKPKIFIVQACKGPWNPAFLHTDCSKKVQGIPDELLILFACTEGFVAYRNSEGSPLIQEFCSELEKNGKFTDIQTIMSSTTKRVIDLTKNNQIPCPSGYLTTPYVFGNYM